MSVRQEVRPQKRVEEERLQNDAHVTTFIFTRSSDGQSRGRQRELVVGKGREGRGAVEKEQKKKKSFYLLPRFRIPRAFFPQAASERAKTKKKTETIFRPEPVFVEACDRRFFGNRATHRERPCAACLTTLARFQPRNRPRRRRRHVDVSSS